MKQSAGFAVLVAVSVAAMRLSSGADAGVRVPPAETVLASSPVEGPKVEAASYKAGCTAYDGAAAGQGTKSAERNPGRGGATALLDTFFGFDPAKEAAPQMAQQEGVRYAIALAPDPVHTNLSLLFDREMVAVQQAAQDDGYTYDSSWMPWRGEPAKYPLLADQQRAEESASHREACPGMLLFRKSLTDNAGRSDSYGSALVVLVVGEQPTGGLNEDQWANAVHWLAVNASPRIVAEEEPGTKGRTLRILGPSFSGSLVALDRQLTQIYRDGAVGSEGSRFKALFPRARILSGSVSSCSAVHWFQRRLAGDGISPAIQFGAFQENDELHIFRFFSYLKALGTDLRDTAILSEDETAYANNYHPANVGNKDDQQAATAGKAPCDFPYGDENRSVRMSYPRDISALRAAYEKQSVFTAPGRSQAAHPILQEGAEQGVSGASADTIKVYSTSMSAVAQEAVLYGIVSYLRTHHTRYLLLRCSNPLDFLFLTRFFHRAYPEGRIVTLGSDLLYRREIDTTEFRGVLALSSYPLLPLNQHWSKLTESPGAAPAHVHRVFESHFEGAYIAGRFLFDDLEPVTSTGVEDPIVLPWKENIPDYADPFWMHTPKESIKRSVAPTWITVVGRDGYWPVAVLNETSTPVIRLDDKDGPASLAPPSTMIPLVSDSAHYERTRDKSAFHSFQLLRFPLSWKIAVGGSLLLLLYQVMGITLGARLASSTGLFSVFRRFPSFSQAVLHGINSAFAAMLLLALLSIGFAAPAFSDLASESWDFWGCLGGAVLTVVSIAVVLFRDERRTAAYAFLATLVALAGVSASTLEYSLQAANKVSMFYRMGHLTGGVSPLLPVLFLLAGLYLWSWQAMSGNAMLRCGRPILPKLCGVNRTFGWMEKLRKRWKGEPLTSEAAGWNCLSKSKYRISQEMGKRIVNMASPVSLELEVMGLPVCLAVAAWVCFHRDVPLLSMESQPFALCVNVTLLTAFFLTAAEASRLFWTWSELKRMLSELNRLRLRRTFAKLRAVDANSLWSVSGNLHRVQYLFFSQQLDAVIRLAQLPGGNRLSVLDASRCGRAFASKNAERLTNGPLWEEQVMRPDCADMVNIRQVFADAAADVFNTILWPAWALEKTSLSLENCAGSADEKQLHVFNMDLSDDPTVRTAEEFVCFQYMAFIQNILARMRTMTMSMVYLFLAVCFAISFYPFVPRTQITLWMMANLVLIGVSVISVYAGMERDETLSYIANTRPGHLSGEFWIKTLGFLAGPLIGLVTTQFPSIAESVLAWLQPGLDAIK